MTSVRAGVLLESAHRAHENQEYGHCDTFALLAQTHLLASIDQTLMRILEELQRGGSQ